MEAFRISVKFFADAAPETNDGFVPMFHRWIQGKLVPDHLLVDVADYGHVPDGPGIVLVSYEANFYLDRLDGRLGLTYQRKQPAQGDFQQRLAQATNAALAATQRIEADPEFHGKLSFKTDELQIRIHDRLAAPNAESTYDHIEPKIAAALADLSGNADIAMHHRVEPQSLFCVNVRLSRPLGVSFARP